MYAKFRKSLFITAAVFLAGMMAHADPVPYDSLNTGSDAQSPLTSSVAMGSTPFRTAMDAARRGDVNNARALIAGLSDSVARKTATWALVDAAGPSMSFFEVDQARRDLAGWPRASRRQDAAEKLIETSGKSPREIIKWFGDDEPQTVQGAIALAGAYRADGRADDAAKLVRKWWRTKSFDADAQRTMLTRFADVLTQDDHIKRADALLYGTQGPAARDIIALLPADQQAAAQARLALRSDNAMGNDMAGALPIALAQSPGIAFERAAYLRRHGLDTLALSQLPYFPKEAATTEAADRIWDERYHLVLSALRAGDPRAAYAAADAGLTTGSDAAESEFYAGWIALRKLNDPDLAERHFKNLEKIGASPITKARALYWRGRAVEAQHDPIGAQDYYARAARFYTTFYGQLAGEKLGQRLTLASDPVITPDQRSSFEAREPVQAARLLYNSGYRDLYRSFLFSLDDTLPTLEDQEQLVDMARAYGDQDTSMKVVRAAAQRGFILAERGYPVRNPPLAANAPEPALVLGITRQESGFDPMVRSGVGARGMMQLMPATASVIARRNGMDYSPSMLDDPDYNMRLGSTFLGQLVSNFSGSYVMAIAGYNAGPGRPTQWSAFCGDPRGGTSDPIDFIECIPFNETRNYVMRVMEGQQVYRAKLNGGSAPITLTSDLQRGSYAYPAPLPALPASATVGNAAPAS